jgi:P4 family phage/plasmid primase-like protien
MTGLKNSTNDGPNIRLVTKDGAAVDADDDVDDRCRPPADPPTDPAGLDFGSDVEIARRLADDLSAELGEIHWCEGRLWFYGGTHWVTYPAHRLRLAAHRYDGSRYTKPGRKNPDLVQLGKARVDSIVHEMTAMLAAPDFFAAPTIGVNCKSEFLVIDDTGEVQIFAHHPDHRARHVLSGSWHPDNCAIPANSLLARLLDGVFAGDRDAPAKQDLLAETAGAAVFGIATRVRRPKAVILYGATAENGKSAILDMLRGLVPATALAAVPAGKMGDEHAVVHLAGGVLLNASDELSSAAAIASDTFKKIVTGDPVTARDLYKSQVTFRPMAQNVFATNVLPPFTGGIDRGVERRLLPVPFRRVIPANEQVEAIGQRIAHEEPDVLLGFAVEGARRLLARPGFAVPPSSQATLREWLHSADPVRSWVWAQVTVREVNPQDHWVTTRRAYEQFVEWARAEGFRADMLPAINAFVQRVKALEPVVYTVRRSTGSRFCGIRIGDKPDVEEDCA